MAKAKPAPAQSLSREDKLKVLKRAKLYSGSTKIEKGKASGAQKRALAQFRDDIPLLASGRAKAVSVGKAKRKDFSDDLKPRKGRVVVRVEEGERPRYNKKTKTITSTVESHGVRYRRVIFGNEQELLKYKPKKTTRFMVPFRQWGIADSPLFENFDDLQKFMADYEGKGFRNWLDVVEVLELAERNAEETIADA